MATDPRIAEFLGRVIDGDGMPCGSCFQVAQGVIITAWHVLNYLDYVSVGSVVHVDPLAGGELREAIVAELDPIHDLALLTTTTPWSSSCPLDMTTTDDLKLDVPLVVTGVVEVKDEYSYRFLDAPARWAGCSVRNDGVKLGRMTAAAVLPGMSGAPVLTGDGMVAGMVSARFNSMDGWLRDTVWVTRTEDILSMLERSGRPLANQRVHLREPTRLVPARALRVGRGIIRAANCAVFSSDGYTLATVGDDAYIRLWDSRSGQQKLTIRDHRRLGWPWREGGVKCAAFSLDGMLFASGSLDGTIRLWDARTGEKQHVMKPRGDSKGTERWVLGLAFSPDSQSIAYANYDGEVGLLSTSTGEHLRYVMTHMPLKMLGAIFVVATGLDKDLHSKNGLDNGVTFSPCGKLIATFGGDQSIRLWETASPGRKRPQIIAQTHSFRVHGVEFAPDSRSIASCGNDGAVRIWDAASGESLQTLSGHGGDVASVAYSPDGRLLASGGGDKTVRLWSPGQNQQLEIVTGHNRAVRSVAFSSDGQYLASCDGDTLRTWTIAGSTHELR